MTYIMQLSKDTEVKGHSIDNRFGTFEVCVLTLDALCSSL